MQEKTNLFNENYFSHTGKIIHCDNLSSLLSIRDKTPDLRIATVIRKDGVIVPNTNSLINYFIGKILYGYLFLSSKLLDTDVELCAVSLIDRTGFTYPLSVPIKICDFQNLASVYNEYVSEHEKEIIGLDDKTFALSVSEVYNNIIKQRELVTNPLNSQE